jgi:hypothetical protein
VSRRGRRCCGERGHGALHHAEIEGVLYVWSDETSPESALELYGKD